MIHGAERGRCGVPWGVCPFCGYPLVDSGGKSWCEHDGCIGAAGYKLTGTGWLKKDREPCPDTATELITDHNGDGGWVCRGHGAEWRRRYTPLT